LVISEFDEGSDMLQVLNQEEDAVPNGTQHSTV